MSGKEELKKEIEEKKRKLAELKAKREARKNRVRRPASRRQKSKVAAPAAAPAGDLTQSSSPPKAKSALDLVGDIIGTTKELNLKVAEQTTSVQIMPVTKDFSEKEAQTDKSAYDKKDEEGEEKTKEVREMELRIEREELDSLRKKLFEDKLRYDKLKAAEEEEELEDITLDELRSIENSKEYQIFFGTSSKIIERALNFSNYDITVDRALYKKKKANKDELVTCCHSFNDSRTVNRAVTAISFNPKNSELLLASYSGQNDPMSLEPDGTVLIWNMHMPSTPEQYFSCNSAVLTAQFHPSNPKLIVGGCQSGQVVIWDMREKRTGPKFRTNLSLGHTYPVYAIGCVPVASKVHNIVSVSTDGMMCSWQDDNLHDPVQTLQLGKIKGQTEEKKVQAEVTTTSYDYPGRDAGNMILGSDEGNLYKARTYDDHGIWFTIENAHAAPITSVNFHPILKNSPGSMSDIFLTSSYDWTTKLWSSKTNRLLYTFESAKDYVFDAQWSPAQPAVFATGDGTGKLDVWNLNTDTDVPAYSIPVEKDKGAISRLKWSEDGKYIVAGMSLGSMYLLEVMGDLAECTAEEATAFYTKMNTRTTTA